MSNLRTGTYIVQGNRASNSQEVMKIQILEVTEHSVLYKVVDSDSPKIRKLITVFNYDYKIIEDFSALCISEG